jgi:hypothetical protein
MLPKAREREPLHGVVALKGGERERDPGGVGALPRWQLDPARGKWLTPGVTPALTLRDEPLRGQVPSGAGQPPLSVTHNRGIQFVPAGNRAELGPGRRLRNASRSNYAKSRLST